VPPGGPRGAAVVSSAAPIPAVNASLADAVEFHFGI